MAGRPGIDLGRCWVILGDDEGVIRVVDAPGASVRYRRLVGLQPSRMVRSAVLTGRSERQGFVLGLLVLMGQRMVATVLMIVLEIIVTPILASYVIPYFLNGQRLLAGVAMDQLRPVAIAGGGAASAAYAPGRVLLGGRAALQIPPMPTWAMVTVIVGWIVGWSVIGAWRMATRDA